MNMMMIPTIDMAQTGANICAIRRQRGISVRQLQEFFGFATPQAIYKWQHGDALPSIDNLVLLSAVLNVSMDELIVTRSVPVYFTGRQGA